MTSLIRNSYTVSQKLKAIELAGSIGVCAASRQLSISKSCLSRWISRRSEYLSVKPSKQHRRKLSSGSKPRFLSQESFLYNQIVNDRETYLPLSLHDIRNRMMSLVSRDVVTVTFKASYGWLRGFMKRYNLGLRTCTTRVIKSLTRKSNVPKPVSKQDKIESFHRHLSNIISEWKRDNQDYDIWNMDETPIWPEMPSKTIDIRDSKKVAILITGYTSARITAVLCCSSEGRKIDSLILASKTTLNPIDHRNVLFNRSGYMTENIMMSWINDYFMSSIVKRNNILVLDSCRSHITDKVKSLLRENHVHLSVIPGGCTSEFQPQDVSVNRSFKAIYKHNWLHFHKKMRDHKASVSDSVRRLISSNAIDNVVVSWNCIKQITIGNGFRRCRMVTS